MAYAKYIAPMLCVVKMAMLLIALFMNVHLQHSFIVSFGIFLKKQKASFMYGFVSKIVY